MDNNEYDTEQKRVEEDRKKFTERWNTDGYSANPTARPTTKKLTPKVETILKLVSEYNESTFHKVCEPNLYDEIKKKLKIRSDKDLVHALFVSSVHYFIHLGKYYDQARDLYIKREVLEEKVIRLNDKIDRLKRKNRDLQLKLEERNQMVEKLSSVLHNLFKSDGGVRAIDCLGGKLPENSNPYNYPFVSIRPF